MEFGKLQRFRKTRKTKPVDHTEGFEKHFVSSDGSGVNNNNNGDNTEALYDEVKVPAKPICLEEIRPETTSEGYGLRTPYGTHLNLDFVKYCEELTTESKLKRSLSFRTSRSYSSSYFSQNGRHIRNRRLTSKASNESLNSIKSDGVRIGVEPGSANIAASTLFETRRRLEAFRSYRSKSRQSNSETSPNLPQNDEHDTNDFQRRPFGSNCSSCALPSENATCNLNGPANTALISPQDLQTFREQMKIALSRIKELEKQVEEMPVLERKVSMLEVEKRQLSQKLNNANASIAAYPHSTVAASLNNDVIIETASAGSRDQKRTSSRQAIPPPVPKRRFCSVAVGGATPLKEVVWQSIESPTTALSHATSSRTFSDFSCCVTGPDIDAELDVFPPPPPSQLLEKATLTNNITTTADFGSSRKLHHQGVLSRDAIWRDRFSKNAAKCDVGVCTISNVTVSKATACDDLIQCKDIQIGPGHVATTKDASVATEPVAIENAAVSCHIKKHSFHKMTMTLTSKNQTGNDIDLNNHQSVSTNTDAIIAQNHFDNTLSVHLNNTTNSDFPIAIASNCENQSHQTISNLSIQQPISSIQQPIFTSSWKSSAISGSSDSIRNTEEVKKALNVSSDIGCNNQTKQKCSNRTIEEISPIPTFKAIKGQLQLQTLNFEDQETTPLKSIMKKSGSLTSPKKFLRFAEGVKSDDESSYSEESDVDEISDEGDLILEDEEEAEQATNETKSSYSEASIFFSSVEISDPNFDNLKEKWFDVAGQQASCISLLQEFLVDLSNLSSDVLRKVVNMTDDNGNTVLHYAISHGNVAIIQRLIKIEELNMDPANLSGYTPAMLAALCELKSANECAVFEELFSKSNVNLHAAEAGQTALMLAVSHGRVQTAELLLRCGADINATDNDGSTALMCAAQHGEAESVKLLLSSPSCDAKKTDMEGCTALSIAMDVGHKEIAAMIYLKVKSVFTKNSLPIEWV